MEFLPRRPGFTFLYRVQGGNAITTANDIPLIIEQISRCLYLASISGNNIAEALLSLARQLKQRALELGAEPASLPEIPVWPGSVAPDVTSRA
jgi:hypothetical protein